MYTHARTHRHARAHRCPHIRAHAHIGARTHARAHVRTHMQLQLRARGHSQTQTCTTDSHTRMRCDAMRCAHTRAGADRPEMILDLQCEVLDEALRAERRVRVQRLHVGAPVRQQPKPKHNITAARDAGPGGGRRGEEGGGGRGTGLQIPPKFLLCKAVRRAMTTSCTCPVSRTFLPTQ